LRGVNSLEELAPEGRREFIELTGYLVCEGDKANLIHIYDGNGGDALRQQQKVRYLRREQAALAEAIAVRGTAFDTIQGQLAELRASLVDARRRRQS
jgi:hypothetical protein